MSLSDAFDHAERKQQQKEAEAARKEVELEERLRVLVDEFVQMCKARSIPTVRVPLVQAPPDARILFPDNPVRAGSVYIWGPIAYEWTEWMPTAVAVGEDARLYHVERYEESPRCWTSRPTATALMRWDDGEPEPRNNTLRRGMVKFLQDGPITGYFSVS